MQNLLTNLQAFKAMFQFLDLYYERTKSDDVGSLLGGMQLFPEGGTWDPAAWGDWQNSVNSVLKEHGTINCKILETKTFINPHLSTLQAFEAMRKFLEIYHELTSSEDVSEILNETQILSSGTINNPAIFNEWMSCVEAILEQNEHELYH